MANGHVLAKPSLAKRLSTPADWPLWLVVLVHVPVASPLAIGVIVLVRTLAN